MREILSGHALVARAEAASAVALPHALGVEFLDPGDPTRGVRLPVRGLAVTPSGTLHAAALGAALELAAYLAVAPTLTVAEHAVTHHIATQHLRAAVAGSRVEVSAQLERRTRALAFVTVAALVPGTNASGTNDERRRLDQPTGPDRPTMIALSQITKSLVEY